MVVRDFYADRSGVFFGPAQNQDNYGDGFPSHRLGLAPNGPRAPAIRRGAVPQLTMIVASPAVHDSAYI
jgi:hypothetical protein